jgi:hypothetical protein
MSERDADKGEHGHRYQFTVDGKPFFSDQPVVSGAVIKALAGDDPRDGLFIEPHAHDPAVQVGDAESIDLHSSHHFFTMPQANFGSDGHPLS